MDSKKRVMILGCSYQAVFRIRGELIERLVKEGHEVIVAFPNGVFGEGEETSRQYGCRFIETPFNRRATDPAEDLRLLFRYCRLIKKEKPDIVLAYTVKCDIYGGIACRLTGTPFAPNITGIGKALAEGGALEKLTVILYRAALRKAKIVYFQNEQDREYFIKNHIRFERCAVLPGSGVNLDKYKPLAYPSAERVVFTFVARVMKAKGIEQFLDAAKALKGRAEFHICGYCEEDYRERIEKEETDGTVFYHGLVDNVIDQEKNSHCIVLPSFHPEGISNVLLEAAALARPVITTDRTGCRETVDDGVTGLLVKERDSRDLIVKMEIFLNMTNEDRQKMGRRGRIKMEKEFDRQTVVEKYMSLIREI